MVESLTNIEKFSKNLTKEKFCRSRLRQSAIIREFEIVGEAAKNLSNSFRTKYPMINWAPIIGFRDKLIHHYFGLNLERIWSVIVYDLPSLKQKLREIVNQEDIK
jgi:uncharacterized protein with HEPN domain